jgi:hypothetical protein
MNEMLVSMLILPTNEKNSCMTTGEAFLSYNTVRNFPQGVLFPLPPSLTTLT